MDELEWVEAVAQWGADALKHVPTQTPAICLRAVQTDPRALKYVHTQTPELCRAAVDHVGGLALQFVREQTLDLCTLAYERGGLYVCQFMKPEFQMIIQLRLLRDVPLTTLPSHVKWEGQLDPITLDPLQAGMTVAWVVDESEWYLAGTREYFQFAIMNRYKGSSHAYVFVPIKHTLVEMKTLRWTILSSSDK
jgi:hypothetical protein